MTREPVVSSGLVSPVDRLDLDAVEADLASVPPELFTPRTIGDGPMRRLIGAVPALVAEVKRLRVDRDDADRVRMDYEDERDEARQERDEALAAVERVRALHRHLTDEQGIEYCEWCDDNGADYGHELPLWPCPTIRALDGQR